MKQSYSVAWYAVPFLVLGLLSAPETRGAAYTLPENGDSVVGAVTTLTLRYEDTLAGIAQEYGIGFQELLDANPGIDPWLPGEGTVIELPTQYVLPSVPREGLVVNVAEYRLYYYPKGTNRVITYPVGVGRAEYPTPLVTTRVVGRIENPSWTPTAVSRKEHAEMGDILPPVVPAGPENPLGPLAIQLAEPGYFIHGTNKPFGVGQQVSQGCIRLYNEHIRTLAELIPNGTRVTIINEPVKVGRRYTDFYVEGHRDLFVETRTVDLRAQVARLIQQQAASADWRLVDEVLETLTGVPVRI